MTDYVAIFQPLVDQLTQSQLQTIFMAWLPVKLESRLSGIMAVDMFLISAIAAALAALMASAYGVLHSVFTGRSWGRDLITVQVEYYVTGTYGDQYTSTLYEALSWLISSQTKKLPKGSFIVQSKNPDYIDYDDEDECRPPEFNILPENGEEITVEYKQRKFKVSFSMPETGQQNNSDSNNNNYSSNSVKPMPSIYLTTQNEKNPKVDMVSEFIDQVTRAYLEDEKKKKTRGRYERGDGYWYRIQALNASRGLDTVALDEPLEILLKKELDTFASDKEFYARIGMPYRRGILLYGKPGTGKTSLINAISAQLQCDLYFLNLKNIKQDKELSAAFSSVPANQIIVLEDVDTQSKVLHKRSRKSTASLMESFLMSSPSTSSKSGEDKSKGGGGISSLDISSFSLSTFLTCMDGNILAPGIIIILTTNHIEVLDPAVIRSGRMDVRLNLGYCTHYQIKRMYKSVTEDKDRVFPEEILEKIPEHILPPCEVMMTMVLYRNEPDSIPEKVYELVGTYSGKEYVSVEELIRLEEEEARREQEEKANNNSEDTTKKEGGDENKDKVDEKKDKVDEKKDKVDEKKFVEVSVQTTQIENKDENAEAETKITELSTSETTSLNIPAITHTTTTKSNSSDGDTFSETSTVVDDEIVTTAKIKEVVLDEGKEKAKEVV